MFSDVGEAVSGAAGSMWDRFTAARFREHRRARVARVAPRLRAGTPIVGTGGGARPVGGTGGSAQRLWLGRARTLRDLLDDNDIAGLQEWLAEHQPYEIADELARADAVRAVLLFRLLDKDRALTVFEELDPTDQHKVLSGLRDHAFRDVVEQDEDTDDRARLLGEAPAKFARRVLAYSVRTNGP